MATNEGAWLLDDDRAYSECVEGATTSQPRGISTDYLLDEWPVAVQCYEHQGATRVESALLKASILQGIGWTWLKVSVIAVPLSWLALLVAAAVAIVGKARRSWRDRTPPSGGNGSGRLSRDVAH